MQIKSKPRRIAYFFLMLLLAPLLFPLAAAFFCISATIVLCFTLLLLPVLISEEKKVSIWIPVIFYPVMLIYYFAPLYFGRFVRNQLIDLVTFYANYLKAMLSHLVCCSSNQNSESIHFST